MKILLDTHVLIWLTTGGPKLPASLLRQFLDVSTSSCVSQISLVEMAIKSQFAKEDYPWVVSHWLERFQLFNFKMLEITDAHLVQLSQLPSIEGYRDPFGRLLIAQALPKNLTLVSHAGKFGECADLKLRRA